MGVPGFSTWLKRRYPEAFQEITQSQSFDHVYVDLPSTLHTVNRKASTKHGLHHLLHRRLDQLLLAAAPRQRVVLALDGPAPLAKLLEQRRRRRREAERLIRAAADREESERAAGQAPSGRVEREQALSSLSLTTGTVLMLELHHSLSYYICRRLADPRYRHLSFELSDSTVKGEGELKILSRLLPGGGGANGDASASGSHESHLVVGGDSDLLLMGMISGQRGLVICEDAHEMGLAFRRREGPLAFSRDALEAAWRRRDHLGPDAAAADVTALALDLTLLAIMSHGNDYLPGCPGLQLSNKQRPGLWDLYLGVRRQGRWAGQWLVNRLRPAEGGGALGEDGAAAAPAPGVQLNMPMLAALLERYHDPRGAAQQAQQAAAPTEEESEEGSGVEEEGGLSTSGSRFLGHRPADPGAYLAGLEWVLSMYSTGAVHDYRFTYFGGPPTPAELVAHMTEQTAAAAAVGGGAQRSADAAAAATAAGGSLGGAPLSRRPRSREPLTPAACALALLPARGRSHAATALRHLMDADSPVAEIYAVCHECRANGDRVKAVSREFAAVSKELAALQAKLTATSLDADGAVDVAGDLLGAAERCEEAQQELRRLLADLSRSQQDHQQRSHPPRPFPTAELEAAVNAVPVESYPKRERWLASFGREMVFAWLPDDAAAAAAGEPSGSEEHVAAMVARQQHQQQGGGGGVPRPSPPPPPSPNGGRPYYAGRGRGNGGNFQFNPGYTPPWLRDCMSFASAYPRLAEPDYLRIAAVRVSREVLPARPYMQLAGAKAAPEAALWRPSASRRAAAPLPSRHLRFIASSSGGGCGAAAAGHCTPPRMAGALAGPPARPARANLVSCAAKLLPRLRMVRF